MVRLSMSTGMISQNNTPSALIPLLRCFDRDFPLGEYLIAVGEKPGQPQTERQGKKSRQQRHAQAEPEGEPVDLHTL